MLFRSAADLRAPTPSAAAELITEAQHKIAEHLANQAHRLDRAVRFQILQAQQRLTRLPVSRAEYRVSALLRRAAQRLDDLGSRQEAALDRQLRQQQQQVALLNAAVLSHDPRRPLAQARERLLACDTHIDRSLERLLHALASTHNAFDARLHSLSPLAVLDRGYALVIGAEGSLIRSIAQINPGDRLTTRLADGAFTSQVGAATPLDTGNSR